MTICPICLQTIMHPGEHNCLRAQPYSESTQQEPTGRTTFATGATRDENVAGQSGGKFPMRFDLLFSNTDFLKRMSATYGEGAAKYGDDNWRNGMPEKSLFNHCLAHLVQHLEGDTTEDHLAHATWNLITLMWVQANKPQLLDLTSLVAKGKLQPCNTGTPMQHKTPEDGEGGVPQMHEQMIEPNVAYRAIQIRMANEIESMMNRMDSFESRTIQKAREGIRLREPEYRALVAAYLKYRK